MFHNGQFSSWNKSHISQWQLHNLGQIPCVTMANLQISEMDLWDGANEAALEYPWGCESHYSNHSHSNS